MLLYYFIGVFVFSLLYTLISMFLDDENPLMSGTIVGICWPITVPFILMVSLVALTIMGFVLLVDKLFLGILFIIERIKNNGN